MIANHALGIWQLALVHLGVVTPPDADGRLPEPNLAAAGLAIDAMATLVDGLGDRLGVHEAVLRDALRAGADVVRRSLRRAARRPVGVSAAVRGEPQPFEGSCSRVDSSGSSRSSARDVPALAAAAGEDRSSYGWTPVPSGENEFGANVDQVLAERAAGRRLAFATLALGGAENAGAGARVVGSTSYLDPQRWPGGGGRLDSIEIGATWLAASAQRTAVNTEAKLLMLTYAFDVLGVHRVVLNTDARNERSRAAIARIGATFEGVLHSFRYGVEGTPRDTATFAVAARNWPEVREQLEARLSAR